jgi:hypothetical protein
MDAQRHQQGLFYPVDGGKEQADDPLGTSAFLFVSNLISSECNYQGVCRG